jgi:signal transduction histidine kinase
MNTLPAPTLRSLLGKYREIVVAILFFLLFDAGVLVLNFHLASTIQQDAVGVNLAGRQRMLSQRLAKSLLEVQQAQLQGRDVAPALAEVAEVQRLFDTTLEGFKFGAEVTGGNGKPVWLAAVTHVPEAQAALQAADVLWQPYQAALKPLLALGTTTVDATQLSAVLPPAVAYAQANNLKILKLMNNMTTALEQVATQKAGQLRLIQTVGILLALLNFFFILFHFIRKLRQSDSLTEAAQQETREILGTVNEGLFLLDAQGMIGSQHSEALPKILQMPTVAGQNFLALLRTMVPEKVVQTAEEYLQLLFSPHVNENLTLSLNPLNEVTVMTRDAQGGYQTRYLEFNFRRVWVAGELAHLLATVNDISRRVELARELDAVQAQSRSQWAMLEQLAHVGPVTLRQFTTLTRKRLSEINEVLKEPQGPLNTCHAKAQRIMTKAHGVKGDAASLNLKLFATQVHEMESLLASLRERPRLSGEDFLPVAVQLDEILSHLDALEKIGRHLPGETHTTEQPTCTLWGDMARLVDETARAMGKKALLRLDLLPGLELAIEQQQAMRTLLVQLVRNAVAHGIEAPAVRTQLGKAETGLVHIVMRHSATGELELSVRDDGAGIDLPAIRARLLAKGLVAPEVLATWDERRLMQVLFDGQVSTATETTLQAGRGVGMALVKDMLQTLAARLKVQSAPSKGTVFQLSLPVALTSTGQGRYATA